MEHILTAVNVVIPVFAVIATGYFLKSLKVINQNFVDMAMKVIFNVGLPGMLFSKVSQSDVAGIMNGDSLWYALYVFVATLFMFFIAKAIAYFVVKDKSSRGTFVQGSFRSNYIIIGYSVLFSMFGDAIALNMALVMIVVIPLYNILAIWVLSEDEEKHFLHNIVEVSGKVVRNPLIIAIVLGFIVAAMNVEIPVALSSTISMLGSIGTPLGLIGIGAYLSFDDMGSVKVSIVAVMLKLVVGPLLAVLAAYMLGFSYMESAIIFVLFGSPSAISSFIMATALGGNSKMAANIVIIGTGLSLLTYIVGLSSLGLLYGV